MASDDRIDGYAAAILEIARSEGELERVGDELYTIARAFESSADLRDVLTDRRVPLDRKLAVLGDLLEGKASPLSLGLVNFVVSVGRGADLPAIADRLAARAAGERDAAIAEVRSAIELDDETVARLAAALGEATGKKVEVKTVVDPSLLGGIVARVGDTVIDGSLRHRIEQLRDTLNQ
ncbi:MAG: ATP synthase F1 subunit delta [Actinobacteria bacterium]|jgi:F-type H+-transporting ATPase subunit delta|nr:ATP synthase F1 subunit delta [Actinomycetota bacterium]